jgi:hypothetical protein
MIARCLASCALLWLAPLCVGQTLTVRVINGKNGRALQGQKVTVSLLYDGSARPPAGCRTTLFLKTDKGGEARFSLPSPPPAHLAASVQINWSRWRCSCTLLDSTETVSRLGAVRFARPGKRRSVSKPGEILFVVRPLSLFYRLLGPLEKG